MVTPVRDWSTTPASNGSIHFPEGQNPSTVNDNARDLMAEVREWYAQITAGTMSGAVAGTGDAMTLNLTPDISAYAVNQRFLVKAPGANTVAAPTLAVDGLAAKTIKAAGGAALPVPSWSANDMIVLIYNGTDLQLMVNAVSTGGATLGANNFTGVQTITNASLGLLSLESSDAGATEGPIVDNYRNSASPAVSDFLGSYPFAGKSSTAVKRIYAKILAQILDPTNASEDAILLFQTIITGTLATRVTLGNGLYMAGATGGDPGSGKVNATEYQVNGAAFPISKEYVSSDINLVANASASLTHSLGGLPKLVQATLICTATDAGYAVGDVSWVMTDHDGATQCGIALSWTATQLTYRIGSAIRIQNKGSTGASLVTYADWDLRLRAYA